MADSNQLKILNTSREYVFRAMQMLYDLSIEAQTDKSKISAFKSRYSRVEDLRSEYLETTQSINTLILKINPDEGINMQAVSAFDDLYYSVLSAAEVLLPKAGQSRTKVALAADGESGASTAGASHTYCSKPIAQTRLPNIELPKFDGNIECWQTFYDTYVSIVHENDNISVIEKFHYLISCLCGSALSIAKGVPVTSDNYMIVFNALVDRYQNKRVLAVNYLDKICNFQQVKSNNFTDLRKYTNLLNECVNALKAMKLENLGEFILFYLASRNLDSDTRKRFEMQNNLNVPTSVALLSFLQNYVKIIEVSEPQITNYSGSASTQSKQNLPKTASRTAESWRDWRGNNNNYKSAALPAHVKAMECFGCGQAHTIYRCPTLLGYNLKERLEYVTNKKMCINCLRPNHNESQCFSRTSCTLCGARHHTLLHEGQPSTFGTSTGNMRTTQNHHQACDIFENNNLNINCDRHDDNSVDVPVMNVDASLPASSSALGMCASTVSRNSSENHINAPKQQDRAIVLLGTCVVRVCGNSPGSEPLMVRALIDSGAQDCFMTATCAKRLGLPLRKCNITVAGLGQSMVHQVKGITSCTVQPRDTSRSNFHIQPIVINRITGKMPAIEVSNSIRRACQNIQLADDDFDKPKDIDLLLGAELFHSLYDGQRMELGQGLPVALHSVFGWVITGKLDECCRPPSTVTSLLVSTLTLDQIVKRFWEVEEPPMGKVTNPQDEKCEKMYAENVYQNCDGRYVVPILLKEPPVLGDSSNNSLSRLLNLEKRLGRDIQLKEDYTNFMCEYEALGHMREIDKAKEVSGKYIIPHHCVVRPESVSTKLRVVFDASAKSSNGIALNDVVYTGPKLQNDNVDILTKFRLDEVVFTADICKMYRNIDLRPEDRTFQHVLWRNSPSDPVREYELNTVTYGVSSSPYLAIRTLHQLATDHGAKWPKAAATLLHDTFMDDITGGADSVKAALELKDELIELLQCGKFELRKWTSNSVEFLAQLPSEHCQKPKSFCDESNQSVLKILGVQWDPTNDVFTYALSDLNPACTKRAILSNVARIYDPLGWVTPVILAAKLILQGLWRHQLSWDENIPPGFVQEWQEFMSELKSLSKIQLPRQVIPQRVDKCELIGFCDGSTKAYGCCVYIRTVTDGKINVHLLIGKSKVAPLKPLTVNRLELCSAMLLARVIKHMQTLLSPKLKINRVIAFTDSMTVLSWLNTEPHRLKTFVSHRVVKIIDDCAAENWHHISTHDNPADHCSRGLSCTQLLNSTSWWSGPSWLKEDTGSWPKSEQYTCPPDSSELRPIYREVHTTICVDKRDFLTELMEKYSSLSRVQRILAWCLRFIKNLKATAALRIKTGLTSDELKQSLLTLVRYTQSTFLSEEIETVKAGKQCARHLQKLRPVLDDQGFLRVGGRLSNAKLPKADTHPLLLPKKAKLSNLIIDHHHVLYLHCGPRTLHSLVQRNFWILGIRNLIRSRLSKCIQCFKANPVPCQPIMGDLPAVRVQAARCFQNIGVDFAGPFTLKESRRRNARTYKAYVCVIVCLAVKAIHLEIVTELSTSAFLAALDRFVSRRGLCKLIISDCGTNFVGAKRYFDEINQFLSSGNEDVASRLAERGITWKQSGVKSMKFHLKRVVGTQVLTFEEFMTVLAKIEAVLNSRPLCAISSDPTEVDVLTPGHFLTGGPLVSLPEAQLTDVFVPPLARWQMLKKITQCFWRVWHLDYLHTLQQRLKWNKGQANIQIGDIVTIVEQNLAPLEWSVGRVVQLHPGADSVVRVVTVRTSKGLLRRPVNKLCPLPKEN